MEPYIGEIRMFAGTYAPEGWLFCDGSTINDSDGQYFALRTVLNAVYGESPDTFLLPDLRGRVPVGVGPGLPLGHYCGTEYWYLTTDNLPPHTHAGQSYFRVSEDEANQKSPAGNYWAETGTSDNEFAATAPSGTAFTMAADMLEIVLSDHITEQHDLDPKPVYNVSPFLGINFIICYQGTYPTPP